MSSHQIKRGIRRRMFARAVFALVFAGAVSLPSARVIRADVTILSNRSHRDVRFAVGTTAEKRRDYALQQGDLVPILIPDGEPAAIVYDTGEGAATQTIDPNSLYFFHGTDDGKHVALERIGLVDEPPREELLLPREIREGQPNLAESEYYDLEVKLFVDDEEPARREYWEERLRRRILAASAILEKYARVRLKIVEYGVWDSDDETTDFHKSLAEFEKDIPVRPGQVAIGFSSQYEIQTGRVHLGGTRGPYASHILTRERKGEDAASREARAYQAISERERVEVLVHEIGHHFGAAHSPEAETVMRPLLGDDLANSKHFRIVFDPLNALALNLVSEQLRRSPSATLRDFPARTRRSLLSIYETLARALPEDPAAKLMITMLGHIPPPVVAARETPPRTTTEAARLVLHKIVKAAHANAQRPETAGAGGRLSGDELTSHYVRVAADAAAGAPERFRANALLLALAIGLGDAGELRSNPLAQRALESIETSEESAQRAALIGSPTIHGRRDLAQHFFVSAGLTALVGPQMSEMTGVLKELRDSQGGSGFSFADLTADLAGIALAENVLGSPDGLGEIDERFRIDQWCPPTGDAIEGLNAEKFREQFGSTSDERFTSKVEALRTAVRALTREPDKTSTTVGDAEPAGAGAPATAR